MWPQGERGPDGRGQIMEATKSAKYVSCADTAKLVRAALKENFPGQKFSVKSKTYSGGASITVHWMDGAPEKSVAAVVKAFEGASFDGMIDLKSYHKSELNGELVHFGADFIFTDHSFSAEELERGAKIVVAYWGLDIAWEIKEYRDGAAYIDSRYYNPATGANFSSMVRHYIETGDMH